MADSSAKLGNTNASRRRRLSMDALRKKLRAGEYIRRLKLIADKAETADPQQVAAMRLQADIYSRLLAKCLPDLKAIEHSGSIKRTDVTDKPLTDEQWQEQYATH